MKNFTYTCLVVFGTLLAACSAEEMDFADEALLQEEVYLDCCMGMGQIPPKPYED